MQSTQSGTTTPNRLIHERSPYLIQHANNPVDWFPWGEDAFEKARREDKPILLSIGYSTCHWCHVMERETFSNPVIADVMNRVLVSVKVDREERPDIDSLYMNAVTAMTGSGGWPLNVFLTPDLKPFFGGTYFPPERRGGLPGWKGLVESIGRSWEDYDERRKLMSSADSLVAALREDLAMPGEILPPDPAWIEKGFESIRDRFDSRHGGFSHAPKFPMPSLLRFLFDYSAYGPVGGFDLERTGEALNMCLQTLERMADGGIHDHLGGGFHRYSTDEHWHVPHFEKMLYDNAQLAPLYLDAYTITGDERYAGTARDVLDYVLRDLRHPEGGFCSAEDADSAWVSPVDAENPAPSGPEKAEGAFYVWKANEISRALGPDAEVFGYRYGIQPNGNILHDPHGDFVGRNIIYRARSVAETARRFGLSEEEARRVIEEAREKLFDARQRRPRPNRDEKVLASWNGLMISALARGYRVLGEGAYLDAAGDAARFMTHQLMNPDGKLYRRWVDGERGIEGMADDYACAAQGFLDLFECDGNPEWFRQALGLTDAALGRFQDPGNGGFYSTAPDQDPNLILRLEERFDTVEPSAASVFASVLLRLHSLGINPHYREAAERILERYGADLRDHPNLVPLMLSALCRAFTPPTLVIIAGADNRSDTRALFHAAQERFMPFAARILLSGRNRDELSTLIPGLERYFEVDGRAAAYACIDYSCQLPVTDPGALLDIIDRASAPVT